MGSRLNLARGEVRYYKRHRRWMALTRALWLRLVIGDEIENCELCGKRYHVGAPWHAPQPLWDEVQGHYDGTLCTRCFSKKARALGYRLQWHAIVCGHTVDGEYVGNTNHWHNEVRDWLLMGQTDPDYPDVSESEVWAVVRDALIAAGYELPPISYYPPENFARRRRYVPAEEPPK